MSYQAVNLSGGKDSTAMLLMMLERGERVDEVVTFDFGMEYPEMYEHLAKLESDVGMRFTVLRPNRPFEYYLCEHVISRGKHAGCRGYGFPRSMQRWCTTIKTRTIEAHLLGKDNLVHCIGIALDEKRRCKPGKRYPLVEYGVTELDALKYCRDRGYDWGGLYDQHRRVSCWCCPLTSINDARMVRRHHPELWEELLRLEDRTINEFRPDYSAHKLDEMFAEEASV